jgi:hypothetical protein
VFVNYEKFHMHEDDVEMITFLRQSLEEQFATEPKGGHRVILRFSSGKKEARTFEQNSLIESLYDFVWYKRPTNSKFYLINFSNK